MNAEDLLQKILFERRLNHLVKEDGKLWVAITDAMQAYHESQVKNCDLADVGGSYRMLKEGEKIQVGDEFIDNNGKWRLSGRFDEIYTRNDYYPHRRLM